MNFNAPVCLPFFRKSKAYSFPKPHIGYRKPRAISTEQWERAGQMTIANNTAKRN